MGHYKLYVDVNRQWRWRYLASNGRIIADSAEAYHNKTDALNGINIIRNSGNSPVYE